MESICLRWREQLAIRVVKIDFTDTLRFERTDKMYLENNMYKVKREVKDSAKNCDK